jgi:hypothetical protein
MQTAGVQIAPTQISSGNTELKNKMEKNNTSLAMLTAQLQADSVYDPEPPKPISEAKIVESYCGCNTNTNNPSGMQTFGLISMVAIIGLIVLQRKK